MCILFIYRNPKADSESYRLIIASNRDETLDRPALPAHYWKDHKDCLGGTDMEAGKEGGTWLAISTKGKGGVLLNLKESNIDSKQRKGRGSLVPNYIVSTESADQYLHKLHKENQESKSYNSYNLILFDLYNADIYYLSSSSTSRGPLKCSDDILGFGNSVLERPYKKVIDGKEKFKNIVQDSKTENQEDLVKKLLKFLKSDERHLPDAELQKTCPTLYKELSAIFITIPSVKYGTRTHTIILVDSLNRLTFIEETLMPDNTWKHQVFTEKLTEEKKVC